MCIIYIFNIYITVVSASLEFMDSDTMISEKKDVNDAVQSITAMRKTALLCQVTDPEEKRKIIGDTFMRVANEVHNIFSVLLEIEISFSSSWFRNVDASTLYVFR